MSSLLALGAAAGFGIADFLGGFATRRAPVLLVTLVANVAGGLAALALWAIFGGGWSLEATLFGAVGGLAGLVGLVLLYDALASGRFQIVSPVSAVTGAAVPVVAGIALGDRPERWAIIGLLITPPAIWLLAGGVPSDLEGADDADDARSSSALPARLIVQSFLAGAGFGTFFVLLDQTPAEAGATPLVAARIASLIALGVLTLVQSRRTRDEPTHIVRDAIGFAFAAGATDMAANGFFLWATRSGDLSVVGALTALYPAGTALLAWLLLGERLVPSQRAGLAIALGAAVLLSI